MKLKGISICFSMLKAALSGSYVNFGVFRLYGDDALDNALNIYVKLLLSIPQSDLLDYPKLSQTYYVLLECLVQDHISFLATMEPQVFLYILSSISEGLTALGGNVNYYTGSRPHNHRVTEFKRANRTENNFILYPYFCSLCFLQTQ